MSETNEKMTGAHAKGWICASKPRLHHLIEESQPGFWTSCWAAWLAALRDSSEHGPAAFECLARESGREGVILEVWLPDPESIADLLRATGEAVTVLAGGGMPNGKHPGTRLTVTPGDPTQTLLREVVDGDMVVMREGYLTPEFLESVRQQHSEEDTARELAELRDMVENGAGQKFADFFPKLLQDLEDK